MNKSKIGTFMAVVGCVWMAGCSAASAAPRVANGSTVELTYSLNADDKTIVPAARKETMKVIVGQSVYPQEFERQLVGMKVGDSKQITLRPEQAFGPYRRDQVFRVPNTQLPPGVQLKEGSILSGGARGPMRVVKVFEDSAVVDLNHPLAGKTLNYRLTISKID